MDKETDLQFGNIWVAGYKEKFEELIPYLEKDAKLTGLKKSQLLEILINIAREVKGLENDS